MARGTSNVTRGTWKKAVTKVINLLPLKVDGSFASYDIPNILRSHIVHHRVYNSQPMFPAPIQMTSVHGLLFL
jgi:hypothetical protein